MPCSARRRTVLATLLASLATPVLAQSPRASESVTVYKSPTCGCCNDWITHLEANGFRVKAVDVADTRPYRARFGMPDKLGSCHTAMVAGYVVEGHVPAREIIRMLRERPNALGLAVPEMPIGSPGMDGPAYGGRVDPYDVLLVLANGRTSVFASYGAARR